jgi:hypothetical protein
MKAIFYTQVYENYAWREDGSIGTGADAYFKPKGGDEYVVLNVNKSKMSRILAEVRAKVEVSNDYFRETVVDFQLVEDDYLTEYERSQLEYDGCIVYSPKELEMEFA